METTTDCMTSIRREQFEAEVNVMNALFDSYTKQFNILEQAEADPADFTIFQEADTSTQSTFRQANKDGNAESILKSIIMFIPRLIAKIIKFLKEHIKKVLNIAALKTGLVVTTGIPFEQFEDLLIHISSHIWEIKTLWVGGSDKYIRGSIDRFKTHARAVGTIEYEPVEMVISTYTAKVQSLVKNLDGVEKDYNDGVTDALGKLNTSNLESSTQDMCVQDTQLICQLLTKIADAIIASDKRFADAVEKQKKQKEAA